MINIISCGIFKKEVEVILKELGLKNDVNFLDPGLHVNFNRLEEGVRGEIQRQEKALPTIVIIGQACHPDMSSILDAEKAIGISTANCFEALLGDEKKKLDAETNTYYITSGWFENWHKIFKQDMGWTEVDARMNLGFYDRILLLDTGLCEITDEKLIEFFDFVQVPIEVKKVTLDHLKSLVKAALAKALI